MANDKNHYFDNIKVPNIIILLCKFYIYNLKSFSI